MKKVSLKTIYLTALTAVFLVSFFAFVAFDLSSQQKQAEESLLEEARTFAKEMDAVWQFMDNSQKVINTSADGDYDFKGLHCSIVGKSVGAIFSAGNDYTIRYTNFNPRSVQDKPDEFEAAALTAFNADAETREYYGVAEFEGVQRFRYLQALEVDESCLECHGEPAGEMDITGHVKEGWTLESVGGAISIVIPMDQQNEAMTGNVLRDVAFFLMLTVLIGAVIYLVTTFFVFRPIDRMKAAFGQMGEGRLGVSLDDRRASKEVASLIARFNDMAAELRTMYEHLEDQVASRTLDLQEANAALEKQRDDLETLSRKLAQEARFKSDLLSMVNHELRTPLTSIITFAQISKEACGEYGEAACAGEAAHGDDPACGGRLADGGGTAHGEGPVCGGGTVCGGATYGDDPARGDDTACGGRATRASASARGSDPVRVGEPSRASDRHAREEIEKNSLILLEMINNMLDIARSDAGSMRATCEPMDLGDVVASVRGTMAPLARKYEVALSTKVDPDVPLVNGDYEKTQRILENLASNAIKFTPDGGSVALRVEREDATGDVLMCMEDTGIGIADEDKERIFERFFQVDSTSTRKYNGSGLGLALVREYADIQGFEVGVSSEFGKGSTFTVRIPAAATVKGEG